MLDGLWFRGGEGRAVALLVRSQFRNDQKFRMGVLAIMPMTLLYIIMGVRDHSIGDPFVATSKFSLVTVAVLMFPSMLKMHLARSDSFRASWVFFACPSDRMQIIRSSKNVLVALFLVPYLVFVVALFTYVAGHPVHVLVHVALLGAISHLVLQAALLIDPELPFSRPIQKGNKSTEVFFLMFVMVLIGEVGQFFMARLYASPVATIGAFAVVWLAGIAIDRLTRARVARQTASLEFAG
jgi:hypothetical protein